MKFFVYGTLRKGYDNHKKYIEGKSMFIGDAITVHNGFAFVLHEPAEVQIKGEVYEINDQNAIKELDALEDHPNSFCREIVQVKLLLPNPQSNENTNSIIEAYLYFGDKATKYYKDFKPIPTGDFNDAEKDETKFTYNYNSDH